MALRDEGQFRVNVSFTPEDHAAIREMAQTEGLTSSAWVRRLVKLNLRKLVRELSRAA